MTELLRILDAVNAQPPSSFNCAGRTVEVKPGRMIETLRDFLYRHCYVREFDASLPERSPDPGSGMIEKLRAAHNGRACREAAWVITQLLEDGHIIARKGHASRRFHPGHYVNLDSAVGLPRKDQRVAICRPTESTVLQEGWYYIFGEAVGDSEESDDLIRFYWNLRAEGACELVRLAAPALDRFQIPFRLKFPIRSDAFERRDSVVLYANRLYYPVLTMILADIRDRISPHLGAGTPLFTLKLADGLGLAEDPTEEIGERPGESFGQNRCGIVAQGLISAGEKKLLTREEKLAEVDVEFRRRGLSCERPWLNPLLGNAVARDYVFPAVPA